MHRIASTVAGLAAAMVLLSGCYGESQAVDPATGDKVSAKEANSSGKVPTVKLPRTTLTDGEEEYGYEEGEITEVHVQLESGKIVACLYNTYHGTIDTCDWENPLKAEVPR